MKKCSLSPTGCGKSAHLPSFASATLYKILHAEGCVAKRRKKHRVAPFPQPFSPVNAVNELWSADYKGQFKLLNGIWCYPLTVMDHQSRYLLCCHGLEGPRFEETRQAFQRIFQEFGLPGRIRTDNGVPFATTATGGLSRLAIWWITLGIFPERIEPGKPQQNGRHERMHRTLKQAATQSPGRSLADQQRILDQFRHEYNQERPHETLQQQTPASHYQPSLRPYTDTPEELTCPDYYVMRRVQQAGVVNCHGKMVYVSHLLKGLLVGLVEVAEGIWDVKSNPMNAPKALPVVAALNNLKNIATGSGKVIGSLPKVFGAANIKVDLPTSAAEKPVDVDIKD